MEGREYATFVDPGGHAKVLTVLGY